MARHTYKITRSVEIEWELENGRFSMTGAIWNHSHTDWESGGQNLEEIAEMFPENAKVQRMVEIWRRWHLNDMRAGCEHQRNIDTTRKVEVVTYKLTREAHQMRRKAEKEAQLAAVEGRIANLTDAGKFLIGPDWFRDLHSAPDADSPLSGLYEVSKREMKAIGWITQDEHPEGMLSRPCEVCGYKYGSAWLKEEIPAEVIAEIESWSTPVTA